MPNPQIPAANIRLSYPLYASDFDPHNANRLVVGGGGGATIGSGTGVGNKITVLDASQPRGPLFITSEIVLSRDEDSVNTLAVGGPATRPRGPGNSTDALIYAGINSSAADMSATGRNDHFRVFSLEHMSKAKAVAGAMPKIVELSRTSLLSSGDAETYQRLLRISQSPPLQGPGGAAAAGAAAGGGGGAAAAAAAAAQAHHPPQYQIGAVATGTTGVAREPQIALFDLSGSAATAPKLRGRIDLQKEAMDLDVMQVGEDHWQVVYCDNYDIHIVDVFTGKGARSTAAENDPRTVFTIPADEPLRPSLRSIRFLTPNFVLAVANMAKASGVLLYGFRLPERRQPQQHGKAGGSNTENSHGNSTSTPMASLAMTARLPKNVTRASALALRNLAPPTMGPAPPAIRSGDTQFVVAVAGQDSSIALYTLDHKAVAGVDTLAAPRLIRTLKNVHPGPISGLIFSFLPAVPAPSSALATGATKFSSHHPLVLKLGSTGSMADTCAVHTIPLRKIVDKPAHGRGPPRPPRYAVALGSKTYLSWRGWLVLIAAIVLLLSALLQVRVETSSLARYVTPASWHNAAPGPGFSNPSSVPEFLARHLPEAVKLGPADRLVVRSPGGDGADASSFRIDRHDAEEHPDAMDWDQLTQQQREAWKARLKEAGHWVEEMGEAVLKGVLFGQLAGEVGDRVA